MSYVVEHLDEVRIRVPVEPSQAASLAAALERYGCDTVGGLAEVLVLRAMQQERVRAAVLSRRGRVIP